MASKSSLDQVRHPSSRSNEYEIEPPQYLVPPTPSGKPYPEELEAIIRINELESLGDDEGAREEMLSLHEEMRRQGWPYFQPRPPEEIEELQQMAYEVQQGAQEQLNQDANATPAVTNYIPPTDNVYDIEDLPEPKGELPKPPLKATVGEWEFPEGMPALNIPPTPPDPDQDFFPELSIPDDGFLVPLPPLPPPPLPDGVSGTGLKPIPWDRKGD